MDLNNLLKFSIKREDFENKVKIEAKKLNIEIVSISCGRTKELEIVYNVCFYFEAKLCTRRIIGRSKIGSPHNLFDYYFIMLNLAKEFE